MTIAQSADERLLAPYRVMRRVTPPEHPWSGLLVRAAERPVVLVPSAEVGEQWPGWAANPDGHIVTPLDVVRRADGHDIVMPQCPHRLADVIARRNDGGRPLDAGEAVTVGVSILRAIGELRLIDPTGSGEWWITDGGMPVLAAGTTFARAGALEGADIVRAMLPCDPVVDAALEDVTAALEDPGVAARTLLALESRLFACAEPTALAVAVLSPRRARAGDTGALAADVDMEPRRGLFERLAHHVDDDLADAFSVATTAAWRGLTRRRMPGRRVHDGNAGEAQPSSRRRPVLVGAAIAGVVVAGGLLWPGGDDPRSAEAAPMASADPSAASPTGEGAGSGDEDAAPTLDADDLATIASDLLVRRSECAGEDTCLALVLDDPATELPAGAVDLPVTQRTLTLLDEYGGAAVLRADATSGVGSGSPTQFVVLIAREGEWLIRDVHDVADQP